MPGPPKKEGVPPAGNGDTPLDFIAVDNSDRSDTSLEIPLSQLRHRPIGPGELASLRAIFWRQAGAGHRLPAERDVIVVDGGRS